MRALKFLFGLSLVFVSCSRSKDEDSSTQRSAEIASRPSRSKNAAEETEKSGTPHVADSRVVDPGSAAPAARSVPTVGAAALRACPSTMVAIPAGRVWVGTREETYEQEENPRFLTKVGAFCAGLTEVTTAEYESCVATGKCTASHDENFTCNTVAKGRAEHPINCIDHDQAVTYCAAQGARLPTEIEWEYLARSGEEMRPYGIDGREPEGNVCWKNHQSCPVRSFRPGSFGLYDLTGNVWEWTSDWFGSHPWPQEFGRVRIYKGGGWSRRFEKWLRPNLRNRLDPKKFGSHLGMRCVRSVDPVDCPYGKLDSGLCRAGVDEVECVKPLVWNGVRCAKKGSRDRCLPGTEEKEGRGCVAPLPEIAKGPLDVSGVKRFRSSEFDTDCQANQPTRPHAYRYEGAGHLERNQVGKADGCKNRDVGVGFNSACCP